MYTNAPFDRVARKALFIVEICLSDIKYQSYIKSPFRLMNFVIIFAAVRAVSSRDRSATRPDASEQLYRWWHLRDECAMPMLARHQEGRDWQD